MLIAFSKFRRGLLFPCIVFVLLLPKCLFSEDSVEVSLKSTKIDILEKQLLRMTSLRYIANVTSSGSSPSFSYEQKFHSQIIVDQAGDRSCFFADIDNVSDIQRSSISRKEEYYKDGQGLSLRYNVSDKQILNIWSKKNGVRDAPENLGWRSVYHDSTLLAPLGLFRYKRKQCSIFDLLSEMPPETRTVTQDNDVLRIEASSENERVCAEFLPGMGGAIKMFSIEVLHDFDKTFGLKRMEYRGENFVMEGEFSFPRRFAVSIKAIDDDGNQSPTEARPQAAGMPELKSDMTVDIDEIYINPKLVDNDFTFKTSIENGTDVFVEEIPQIKHVWWDGKVVPWTDELALARARGHGFVPGVREPRFWMMALGIGLILFALGVKIREMLKKRSGNN